MSLAKSWDYNGKKISLYHNIINYYNRGDLSRAVFAKEVAPQLEHDPLVFVEMISYLDGFRKLVNHGRPVVEKPNFLCKRCGDPRRIVVEDHNHMANIKAKYLVLVEECGCFEDLFELDPEMF